ncbi:MAG: hypothetical protein LBQ30_09515 [Treponema sp.]|jgi:energy-coupling factor transporter transmembrane protein EcfT|nr:hypothetical protein [Treponema sp.]
MAYGVSPYAYRAGNTFLHRLPGGIKLLGLLGITIGAFYSGPGMLLSIGIILAGAFSAKIRPRALLRGSKPLFVMIGFVIILRSLHFNFSRSYLPELSLPGFQAGILFGLGIIISFSAGSLLFTVTTMMELKDSLRSVETALYTGLRRLRRKNALPQNSAAEQYGPVSLGISLMLNFLPRFFEVWEEADAAYRARAGKPGIPALILLIPLVTERMILLAAETAWAMEARGVSR